MGAGPSGAKASPSSRCVRPLGSWAAEGHGKGQNLLLPITLFVNRLLTVLQTFDTQHHTAFSTRQFDALASRSNQKSTSKCLAWKSMCSSITEARKKELLSNPA